MKALTKLLLAAAVCAAADVAVSTALAQQTLATWWVNNQTNLPPPNPFTNNTANLNIIAGPMTKGPGIGEPSGTSEYGGNNWTNNAVGGSGSTDTEANAIAGGHYLTYSIQVAPGYTVSFSTNVLYYHVSGTGPGHGELQYSTDGINYTDVLAMPYAGGSGGSSATALMTNVLSGVAALQNIPSTVTNYFRIVNWGATGSSGTWYIYDNPPVGTNGFVVSGSVTPVPPSENLATWWVNNQTNLAPPNPFTNNTAAANITVGAMTKGSGIGEPTGTSEYGGNNWTNNVAGGSGSTDTEANAIAGGHYITYSIQADPGYTISFFTNLLYYHVSATGPGQGELQYSTDGINYTDISAMTYAGGSGGSAATTMMTNNLSGIDALRNIPSTVTNYFRIVNWGATSGGGTWYIYDNPPVGTNGFVVVGGVYSLNGIVAPTNLVVSPSGITANAGQTVSFTVVANGSAASNFWYQIVGSTTNLVPGQNSSTLTLANVLGANSGSYYAVLTNSSGSATSSIVSLTVIDPILEAQPSSVQGLQNGTVQFTVAVGGTAPSYQWYYTDASGNIIAPVGNGRQADGSVVSGATSSTLSIANLQASDITNFVVVAANAYGSVTSSVASFLPGNGTPGTLALTGGVLALWDFDGSQFTNTLVNPNSINNPVPFIGAGAASVVGACYVPGTSPFSGATDPNDVGYDPTYGGWAFTPYGFEQPSPNFSWGTEDYPAVTGTNKANGVQFNVSTAGAKNIQVSYDSRVSATASDYERLQYTTNGTTWIDYPASSTFSGLYGSGNAGYYTFSYSLTGFPGVDNNPNFGIRIVTEWQNTATYGIGTTNFWVGTANSYTSGASGNNAAGTVTYDIVAITGDAITNNNQPPIISGFMNTNTVDTNTLKLSFTASSPQMPASDLTFSAQSVDTVAAGPFSRTVNPAFAFSSTGGSNFVLSISFPGYIPDPVDAAPILVTATDTNGESASTWFLLTVSSINQPPTNTLTSVTATNTLANTPLTIPFRVGSARDPLSGFTYSVASDNNTVVPSGNLVIGGNFSTGNLTLTVTPAANQVGNAIVSVTVNDNDPDEPRSTTANVAFVVKPNTNIVAVDYFNYDNSGSLDTVGAGYWTHLSGVTGQMQVGGGVATVDTSDNTENLQAQLVGSPYSTNSGTVLYSSLVVNMSGSKMPTGDGSYFTAFNDGSGTTAHVEGLLVAATNGAAPGYYRLGVANVSGNTSVDAAMFPQDLQPGVNYFVVVSLAVSNGFSTLWVSPTNQWALSVTNTTPAASPTNLYSIADFELRQSGATAGSVSVGNLMVGLTFDSVFYPAQANGGSFAVPENTTSLLSAMQNDAGWGLSLVSLSPDSNGTASISGTNVSFLPATNFVGTATIGYTIQDNLGNQSSSTLTVTVTNTVTGGNPAPIPLSARASNGSLTLSWTNSAFSLETSTNVTGPYVVVPGATSPYTLLTSTNPARFFRLVH